MNKSERDALVQQYTQGHAAVVEALAGISPVELDAQHDGWTAREVVHHLADSEMTSAIRLRRLLAEDLRHARPRPRPTNTSRAGRELTKPTRVP